MSTVRRPRRARGGAVTSPHYLATLAGAEVLADGGNAVDAAVATNLALGVVAPYYCGFGGDVLAMVWDGAPHGYLGVGRSALSATPERIGALLQQPVRTGPLTVTVPGAVQGWFELLERWGTLSFGRVAANAIGHARHGITLTPGAATRFSRALALYPGQADLHAAFGGCRAGSRLLQPALATTIEALAADGPERYYRGDIADTIATRVGSTGGLLERRDFAAHTGAWVEPLHASFRGRDIYELPAPTQGVTALQTLRALDDRRLPPGVERTHRMIEAMKLALADRDTHIGDPTSMTVDPDDLLGDAAVAAHRARIDPDRAANPGAAVAQIGGTGSICAVDDDGLCISLIQSNFLPLGSGVFVPEHGFVLQSRGASFRLDPTHPNGWGPGKLPLHTLVPALALSDGSPSLVFGTMGADAQVQVHVQLLTRLYDDDATLQEALNAPRWRVEPNTWRIRCEEGAVDEQAMRSLGHELDVVEWPDDGMGHAHLIARPLDAGVDAATDSRAEGLALLVR